MKIISCFFTGSNTVNLSALSSAAFNSGNLNSTGISLVTSTTLARTIDDFTYEWEDPQPLTDDIMVQIQNNPATQYFVLSVKQLDISSGTNIEIYSQTGQIMYAAFTEAGVTSLYNEYSVLDYTPGVYYVSVSNGAQRKMLKLIVLK